jgi:hypothetical protein
VPCCQGLFVLAYHPTSCRRGVQPPPEDAPGEGLPLGQAGLEHAARAVVHSGRSWSVRKAQGVLVRD